MWEHGARHAMSGAHKIAYHEIGKVRDQNLIIHDHAQSEFNARSEFSARTESGLLYTRYRGQCPAFVQPHNVLPEV